MQTMVLEVLIAFGLCVVAETCFQIADSFDCRRRQRQPDAQPNHDVLSVNVR